MTIDSFNALLARRAARYREPLHIEGYLAAATTATLLSGQLMSLQAPGLSTPTRALPSGVTGYVPESIIIESSTTTLTWVVGRKISFGSLNISTNVFTDGSAMPSMTVGNASRNTISPVFLRVTAALNATPGSLQLTYVDQDGHTAETNTAQALTASAAVDTVAVATLNTTERARDITNMQRTGGTSPSGTIEAFGIIPIWMGPVGISAGSMAMEPLISRDCFWQELPAAAQLVAICLGSTVAKRVSGIVNVTGLD